MATRDQLIAGLKAADAAGHAEDAKFFADQLRNAAEPITDYSRAVISEGDKQLSPRQLTGARALELTQGGMLGWGDEFQGLIGGADAALRGKENSRTGKGTFLEGYTDARDRARSALQHYEDARPGEALGVSAAGGLPLLALGGSSLAREASLASKMRSAFGTGAKLGAVAGAGSANGDLEDRVGGAVGGAAVGGMFGMLLPTFPAAVKGATRMVNRARMTPDQFAAHYTSRALLNDSVPLTEIFSPERSIVSKGGEATTSAAEQAALSGKGRVIANDYFKNVDKSREGTIVDQIKKTFSDQPLYDKLDELSTKRATDAKPLYDAAYSAPYRRTPRLRDLSTRPSVGSALRSAYVRLQDDPSLNPEEVKAALGPILGKDSDNLSDAQIAQRFTQGLGSRPMEFKVLDYVKRGLDHLADSPTGTKEVRDLRRAWREELKTINPKYVDALSAWAGPSRVMEALEQGRTFHKMDPELIAREMADMGDSEREAFRIGVSRNLQDSASGATGRTPGQKASLNLADAISGNKVMQRRLEAVLGAQGTTPDNILARAGWKKTANGFVNPNSPDKIITLNPKGGWSLEGFSKTGKSSKNLGSGVDTASLEHALTGRVTQPTGPQSVDDLVRLSSEIVDEAAKKKAIIGGSPTARRIEGANEFEQVGNGLDEFSQGLNAARGGKFSFAAHTIGRIKDRVLDGMTQQRRDVLSKMLFSTDPQERQAAIEAIEKIRSGKKVDLSLYNPGIAPRAQGALITNASQGGN